MLTAMLNQETRVRAFVSTTDPVFLDLYNQGHSDFITTTTALQKGFTSQPGLKT
jgi:CHASE3 domain sensor protein